MVMHIHHNSHYAAHFFADTVSVEKVQSIDPQTNPHAPQQTASASTLAANIKDGSTLTNRLCMVGVNCLNHGGYLFQHAMQHQRHADALLRHRVHQVVVVAHVRWT